MSSQKNEAYETLLALIESDLQDYPPTLQAKHLSKYMGVSLGVAYKLLKSQEFPSLELPDSKFILVPKSVFSKWYAAHLCKNKLDESGCDEL